MAIQFAAEIVRGARIGRIPRAESELDTAYHQAARARTLDNYKQPERERVLRHILDNRATSPDNDHPFTLLTNPGIHWHFERMVEAELGEYKARFIGIERNWSTLEFGLQYMPGRNKTRWSWESKNESLVAVVSGKSIVYHCHMEGWAASIKSLVKAHPLEVEQPKHRSRTRHMVVAFNGLGGFWIDLWGPCMVPGIAGGLRNLVELLPRGAHLSWLDRVPYAITGLYGRDPYGALCGNSVDLRAAGLAYELTRHGWQAETTACWSYSGFNNARMMTVCGILRRQKEEVACLENV